MRKIQPLVIGATLLVVVGILAACGDAEESPAASGSSARTVAVAMIDDLRFEPSSIEVNGGETVRFVLTNDGAIVHDFSPGTAMDHGGGMGSGGEMGGTAVVLAPGETGELTYVFDQAGEVEFGCHQPGHFEAGMVFTAHVS